MTARPTRTARQLRFTQLKLLNWRNFRSAEIDLGTRVFILGPNAGGKSNLLDAFRFLAELAQPGSGGLQAAIERRGGLKELRSLFARDPSDVLLAVSVGDDAVPRRWIYEVQINRLNRESIPTVVHERVREGGKLVAEHYRNGGDARDSSQTMLEQNAQNRNFRGLQEFLASSRYLHVVPQIVRDRARARSEGEDSFGGDLLRRMKDMPNKSRTPRLTRIAEALKLSNPFFETLDLVDDSQGVPHLETRYKNWRGQSARQREPSFSDGTLRLIGLLWSMGERGGPLLLEEPELSLNEAVVGEIPRMLERMQKLSSRQVIVTTHAGALLDDSGVGLAETYIITVGRQGSTIAPAIAEKAVVAQVEGGMTVSQAVLPLIRPNNIERLGRLDVAG